MLYSECNKLVPFICRLFFRVPLYYLPPNEMPPPQFEKPVTPLVGHRPRGMYLALVYD